MVFTNATRISSRGIVGVIHQLNEKYIENLEAFCADLDVHLKLEFGYKRRIAVRGLGPTIAAKRKAFWIYIRYHIETPFECETLVLSTISFKNTRNGHGTRLLAFLISIADKHNYRFIRIENVGQLSETLAVKYGFTLYKPVGNYSNNGIIEVDKLRNRLSSRSH